MKENFLIQLRKIQKITLILLKEESKKNFLILIHFMFFQVTNFQIILFHPPTICSMENTSKNKKEVVLKLVQKFCAHFFSQNLINLCYVFSQFFCEKIIQDVKIHFLVYFVLFSLVIPHVLSSIKEYYFYSRWALSVGSETGSFLPSH